MKTNRVHLQLAMICAGGGLAHLAGAFFLCWLAGVAPMTKTACVVSFGTLALFSFMAAPVVYRVSRYLSAAVKQHRPWNWTAALIYGVYAVKSVPTDEEEEDFDLFRDYPALFFDLYYPKDDN